MRYLDKYHSEIVNFLSNSGIEFRNDVSLSQYSYIKIGGTADYFITPKINELPSLIKFIYQSQIPYHVIGGGSNTLFFDDGFRGVVLSLKNIKGFSLNRETNSLEIYGGENLSKIVFFAEKYGLTGIERLAGIPGNIGGAIVGNAGAFGMSISDVLYEVELINSEGQISRLKRDEMGFSYRRSSLPSDCIITRANVRLIPEDKKNIRKKTREFLNMKKDSQPVNELSLGCVFKNPEGYFAGKLIDDAGCKGISEGGIIVSNKHANFFVNRGGGTATDYLRLIDRVRDKVFKVFGTSLELEIRLIGCVI